MYGYSVSHGSKPVANRSKGLDEIFVKKTFDNEQKFDILSIVRNATLVLFRKLLADPNTYTFFAHISSK